MAWFNTVFETDRFHYFMRVGRDVITSCFNTTVSLTVQIEENTYTENKRRYVVLWKDVINGDVENPVYGMVGSVCIMQGENDTEPMNDEELIQFLQEVKVYALTEPEGNGTLFGDSIEEDLDIEIESFVPLFGRSVENLYHQFRHVSWDLEIEKKNGGVFDFS